MFSVGFEETYSWGYHKNWEGGRTILLRTGQTKFGKERLCKISMYFDMLCVCVYVFAGKGHYASLWALLCWKWSPHSNVQAEESCPQEPIHGVICQAVQSASSLVWPAVLYLARQAAETHSHSTRTHMYACIPLNLAINAPKNSRTLGIVTG